MLKLIWCTTIAGLLVSAQPAQAAYQTGFSWNWEADFSTTDTTPADYGSAALPANAGKSTGATQNVWAYLDLTTDTLGAVEPTTLVAAYGDYYGAAKGWLRLAPNETPAFGDTTLVTNTSDYMFASSATTPNVPGPEHGRKFICPGAATSDRVTVALRFTAPQNGTYDINATFRLVSWKQYNNTGCTNGVKTQIVKDTAPLTTYALLTYPNSQPNTVTGLAMNAGDHLYFAIAPNGVAGNSIDCDDVLLDLQIGFTAIVTGASDWNLLK